jgi:anti-sigma28 factor (negative regulator of flagellin synthesis)
MTAPITQKPTKKTFHFPKNANNQDTENAAPVAAAEQPAASKPAPGKKASKAKRAAAPASAAPATATAADQPVSTGKASKAKRASAATTEKVSASAEAKSKRAKKDKVVRDSFTMPKSDYDKIAALKQKCLDAGVSVKKSELLRAGLLMLEAAAPKRLLAAVEAVEAVKTGRPANE